MQRIQVGQRAPDFTLANLNGEHITLEAMRQQNALLLVFLRHLG